MPATLAALQQQIQDTLSGDEAVFVRGFCEVLFDRSHPWLMERFEPGDLLALARQAIEFVTQGPAGGIRMRIFRPTAEEHGWSFPGTAVEILIKDRPFLVDSVRAEIRRQGLELNFCLHPLLKLPRDGEGRMLRTALAPSPPEQESYQLYLLEEALEPAAQEALAAHVRRVLDDVVLATDDYPNMRDRAHELAAHLLKLSKEPGTSESRAGELREYAEFLQWLAQHNFIFLGYREYTIEDRDGTETLRAERESSLGILRGTVKKSSYLEPVPLSEISENLRQRIYCGPMLIVTKANSEATVHRPVRMDYIGLKKVENEKVRGEMRFLGLFTSQALSTPCKDIPILRRKVSRVLQLDGSPEGSHDYKQITAIFNSMPREELFWAEHEPLHRDIRTIMQMESEHQVRLAVRPDPLARGVLVMVIMPRERFNAQVRHSIQDLLTSHFEARQVDYQLSIGEEEEQVRFHFFLTTEKGMEGVDLKALETRVARLTRSWEDRVNEGLESHHQPEARRLAHAYAGAFSEAYKASNSPEMAVQDILQLDMLGEALYRVDLCNLPERGWSLLKVYHRCDDLTLSDTMPYLESLGMTVREQSSYSVRRPDGSTSGIDIYKVRDRSGQPLPEELLAVTAEATLALLEKRSVEDRLNGLVLGAGLSWREVGLLRTYQLYLSQIESISRRFINDTMLSQSHCARLIYDFFEARFNPAVPDRQARMADLKQQFLESLNQVSSLSEDRTLRALFNLVEASIRTNYFLNHDWISIKICSQTVESMPEPRPLYEIVVSGPGVDGIHLRGGKVARGGLRWSDRPDFRTEVLGLMKTQMTKNAVIVPVGSKGGFLLKDAPADREQLKTYVTERYKTFIRGLLDLTDNILDGKVVHPLDLVIYDEPDPYLVVAADKGTATFSDIANGVAAEYNFWLGDAFASGGSYGYDHKKEGITARGAWECVKRHFRELGLELGRPFTVAGIGDLSGDVFGNGLIYSDQIKLLAAFNHMHIFLDPDPDPAKSYQERVRMFNLPRSSWEDYDKTVISMGGGVFARHSKSIRLTPQVQQILGVEAECLSGDELIRAVLRMPVDLLWNGGIGVYVKSPGERNVDVGDSNNDQVRVNSNELRCKVVGEGGNNGFTQLARIDYARHGGRINTDAIDNSAGVDMSDHEVNIKILLQPMVASGRLTFDERNQVLGEMTSEVSRLVLEDNYRQSLSLSMAQRRNQKDLSLITSLMEYLEERGGLKRDVEFLPDRKALADRARAGEGLTRPELSIVLAYTKMGLYRRLLETAFPEEPHFQHYLTSYFPTLLAERYPREIAQHQLRREIIATQFTNKVVDLLGMTFVHRTIRDTGATPVGVVRAALMALEILNLDPMVEQVFALDGRVGCEAQYEALQGMVETVESVVNQMLLIHGNPGSVSEFVKTYREPLMEIRGRFPALLPAKEQELHGERCRHYQQHGFPAELAAHIATLAYLPSSLGVVDASRLSGASLERAAQHYYWLGDRLALGWLRIHLSRLAGQNKWETIALEGLIMDLRQVQLRLALGSLAIQGTPEDFVRGLGLGVGEPVQRYDQALEEIRTHDALSLASGGVLSRQLNQMALSLEKRTPVAAG